MRNKLALKMTPETETVVLKLDIDVNPWKAHTHIHACAQHMHNTQRLYSTSSNADNI